jgi:pimeloyl-ACP methyl ester carboxylesterase
METALKTGTRDGVNLRYLDTGNGDPSLMFIHGWCCNHRHWRDQIPEFSRDHRVVAVDLRGLGDSDKPDQDYTVPLFAEDVAWLIREAGLERPVLIGHSMGGQIVLNVVRKYRDLVRAAVFVDSPMVPFSEDVKATLAPFIEGLKSPAYQNIATVFVKNFLFNDQSPVAMKDETAAIMTTAPQRLMHTAMASITSEESMPAGALPVPSLFVRAATAGATEDELRTRYPGMDVVTVDCAHFIQMEKPEETNQIIREFVESLPE